jgi:hypothetical protein
MEKFRLNTAEKLVRRGLRRPEPPTVNRTCRGENGLLTHQADCGRLGKVARKNEEIRNWAYRLKFEAKGSGNGAFSFSGFAKSRMGDRVKSGRDA